VQQGPQNLTGVHNWYIRSEYEGSSLTITDIFVRRHIGTLYVLGTLYMHTVETG